MCIIIVKKLGQDWPARENVDSACRNNPDGFSMAWNAEGKLKTFRTMSKDAFMAAYDKVTASLNAKDTGLVIHARIATHGSKKVENCHCWTGAGISFAHNGVLRDIVPQDDMTDSETFFRRIVLPLYNKMGWAMASYVMNLAAGYTNKFAIIDRVGNTFLFGNYQNDNGIFYSNASYRWGRCVTPMYGYGYGYGYETD